MSTDVSNAELQKARIMMTIMFVKRPASATAKNKVKYQNKLVLARSTGAKQVFVDSENAKRLREISS